LTWREITGRLDPTSFTIDTVPRRLARAGDLWGKEMRRPNSLERALARV
jgi:DNA primase